MSDSATTIRSAGSDPARIPLSASSGPASRTQSSERQPPSPERALARAAASRFEDTIARAIEQARPRAESCTAAGNAKSAGDGENETAAEEADDTDPRETNSQAALAAIAAPPAPLAQLRTTAPPTDSASANGANAARSAAGDLSATIVADRALPLPTSTTGNEPVAIDRAAADDAPDSDSPLELASVAAPDAAPETASDASPAASSATAEVADATLARSTPELAASLAHARGIPLPHFAQASGAENAAPAAPGTPVLHQAGVHTPVGHASFPAHFAAEIALIGAAGVERAEIQLQPRELGPVRIELSLSGESARVAFSAAQPETRHAIEQSLPILKDLLAERGLMLGQASVSDGRAGSGSQESAPYPSSEASRGIAGAPANERSFPADARRATLRRTLLDVYV